MGTEADSDQRDADVERVKTLCRAIHAILYDQGREIQAMVLVDCVALWIAAHFGPEEEIEAFRKEMILMFAKSIWMMIPSNAKKLQDVMTDEDRAQMAAAMEMLQNGSRKH